jgi:hypothetical protein
MNGTEQTNLFLGTKYLVTHDGGTERMTLVRIEDGCLKFLDEDGSGIWGLPLQHRLHGAT